MTIISTSCNRILANHANAVRTATISASSQRPSTDVRLLAEARSGGGRVVVAGAYTGAADTTIDVEVLSGTGGALTASTPLINGVGNGLLTVETIRPAAVPETITFSLLHAGDPADPAVLEFAGTTIAARTPGAAGNGITLGVVRDLTATPTQYATLEPITAGTVEFDGPAWDWGQPPATDAGIPLAALRIQFEGYPTVHRAWKTWDAGRFLYRLDPAPVWDIPGDTRVLAVTGDYTLTLTDGVSPEVYEAITVHDFLAAVASRSALVEVLGVIALDRAPGGMGVTDIPLRTDAHALPPAVSVKSTLVRGLVDVSVDPAAPTENITITHAGRGAGGVDVWGVRGAVSGDLPAAQTGIPYVAGPVEFTVPTIVAPDATRARISAIVTLETRTEDEGVPAICFKPLVLGAAASDKSVTFTYRKRPPADCVCNTLPALRLKNACLGLPEEGDMSNVEYINRLKTVYAWREAFVRRNTKGPDEDSPAEPPVLDCTPSGSWRVEVSVVGLSSVPFGTFVLGPVFVSETGATDRAELILESSIVWCESRAGSDYGVWVRDTNGEVVLLASQPWVSSPGELVPNRSEETTVLQVSAVNVVEVDTCTVVTPGVAADPADGGFHAATLDLDWMDVCVSVLVDALPDLIAAENEDALEQWDALWIEVAADLEAFDKTCRNELSSTDYLPPQANPRYVDRYRAAIDVIRLEAGLLPKPDASGAAGDGCWRDYPDATHWWVDESGEYLPAFTNQPYVSAARDADGNIYPTMEFGFGLVTPCEHRLKSGDIVTIQIRGTANAYTYGEGDVFIIPVIAAAPLAFTGGADGDPTQTWTVRGTVSGALPDWMYNPASPSDYDETAAPLVASLAPAGIPFEQGDSIRLALEGGTLRWRRDGGSWTTANIFGATHSLGDGLTLHAEAGAAPSFVTGDSWTFQALATYGVSRLRQPRIGRGFAFVTDGAVLDLDLGAVLDLEAVLIALHTLPSTATVALSGGDAAIGEWTAAPTVRPGAILAPLPAGTSARYLRITIAGTVTGASIGWIWAGLGWQPTVGASDLTMARQYGIARGAGLNPAGLYRGRGNGGRWSWQLDNGGALLDSNVDALLELVDHVAAEGLEPVCITPDIREPARASIAILDADELVMVEHNNWQGSGRAVSVELPFRAVLR